MWQCNLTVDALDRIDPDKVRMRITASCLPVNGDRFTTLHGQKGVVTILPDSEMPRVGRRVAEIVIGSSSIIKRGTISQLLEAAFAMYWVEHMPYNATRTYEAAQAHYISKSGSTPIDRRGVLLQYESEVRIARETVRRRQYRSGTDIPLLYRTLNTTIRTLRWRCILQPFF